MKTGLRIMDLEERQRGMTDTLIQRRNKLRTLLDALEEEIVSLDVDFNIISANTAFARRFDCRPEDVEGKNCFEISGSDNPPGCKSKIATLVTAVFNSGRPQHLLLKDHDGHGSETFDQITCIPIVNENGQVIQTVVVSKNITEDKRKSDKIQSLNDQLVAQSSQIEAKNQKLEKALNQLENTQAQMLHSEKMASIGQLAAGVAHEINNPTGYVANNLKTLDDYLHEIGELIHKYKKIYADLLNEDNNSGLPANAVEALESIKAFEKDIDIDFLLADIADLIGDCREGTNRIKNIVRDLKNFTHSGDDTLQRTDINHGLNSTLNVVTNEIKYKAAVHKDLNPIPAVRAYPQQLNQVFMNILVNAAQAIEEKGDIYLQTRFVDGFVEVIIKDTGCGIPRDNISKIFDPFFTTKDVGMGTGLGMNIAYNIIQKHKGRITVDSEEGKGAVFTIQIPAVMEDDAKCLQESPCGGCGDDL